MHKYFRISCFNMTNSCWECFTCMRSTCRCMYVYVCVYMYPYISYTYRGQFFYFLFLNLFFLRFSSNYWHYVWGLCEARKWWYSFTKGLLKDFFLLKKPGPRVGYSAFIPESHVPPGEIKKKKRINLHTNRSSNLVGNCFFTSFCFL